VNARQQGIFSRIYIYVRRALLADTPVFVSREIFHSTARLLRSLARSCLPLADVGLSRTLPVEPSWALYLHIGTVSRSGESRKRGFIGPPAEGRDAIRETGSGGSSSESSTGDSHDTYSHGGLSFLLLLFRLPMFPSSLSRLCSCTSRTIFTQDDNG